MLSVRPDSRRPNVHRKTSISPRAVPSPPGASRATPPSPLNLTRRSTARRLRRRPRHPPERRRFPRWRVTESRVHLGAPRARAVTSARARAPATPRAPLAGARARRRLAPSATAARSSKPSVRDDTVFPPSPSSSPPRLRGLRVARPLEDRPQRLVLVAETLRRVRGGPRADSAASARSRHASAAADGALRLGGCVGTRGSLRRGSRPGQARGGVGFGDARPPSARRARVRVPTPRRGVPPCAPAPPRAPPRWSQRPAGASSKASSRPRPTASRPRPAPPHCRSGLGARCRRHRPTPCPRARLGPSRHARGRSRVTLWRVRRTRAPKRRGTKAKETHTSRRATSLISKKDSLRNLSSSEKSLRKKNGFGTDGVG